MFTFLRLCYLWHKKAKDCYGSNFVIMHKQTSIEVTVPSSLIMMYMLKKTLNSWRNSTQSKQTALCMLKCKAAGNWFSMLVTSLSYQFCQSCVHDQTEAAIKFLIWQWYLMSILIPIIKINGAMLVNFFQLK